jgi:hypothetical protein
VGTEFFRAEGRTDRHDEADSRVFSTCVALAYDIAMVAPCDCRQTVSAPLQTSVLQIGCRRRANSATIHAVRQLTAVLFKWW